MLALMVAMPAGRLVECFACACVLSSSRRGAVVRRPGTLQTHASHEGPFLAAGLHKVAPQEQQLVPHTMLDNTRLPQMTNTHTEANSQINTKLRYHYHHASLSTHGASKLHLPMPTDTHAHRCAAHARSTAASAADRCCRRCCSCASSSFAGGKK
jgi:hypothetical protein